MQHGKVDDVLGVQATSGSGSPELGPSFASRPVFWSAWRSSETSASRQSPVTGKAERARAPEVAREETKRRLRASPLYGMYRYSELQAGKEKKDVVGSQKPVQKVLSPMLHPSLCHALVGS